MGKRYQAYKANELQSIAEQYVKEFNPEIHDAVMHIESEEYGEKVVVEELRKGYKMGDRVLRHSMVKVAN